MKRTSLSLRVALVGAVAVGLLGGAQHTRAATSHAVASKGKSKTLLYKANWKKGTAKWALGPGFSVKGGKLTFDGSDRLGQQPALAPFTKTGTNFAVVTSLTVGQPLNATFNRAGLLVHATADIGIDVVYEHAASNAFTRSTTDTPELYAYGNGENSFVPGDLSTPLTGTHTFRTEVRGDTYRLLVDGKEVIPWTQILGPEGGVEGIIGTGIPFTVNAFKILRLTNASVTPVHTLAMGSHVLTGSDLGGTNLQVRTEYFDNWWIAALNRSTPDQVTQSGRLYTVIRILQNDAGYVQEDVAQFGSTAQAQARYQEVYTGLQDPKNQPHGAEPVATSSLAAFDQSFGFTYTYTARDGKPTYGEIIYFQRAAYTGYVDVEAKDQSGLAQKAASLIQAANQHLQN